MGGRTGVHPHPYPLGTITDFRLYFAGDRFYATFNAVKACGTHKANAPKIAYSMSEHIKKCGTEGIYEGVTLQPSVGVGGGEAVQHVRG